MRSHVCRLCICRGICRIWLCYAVCGNWRMYAVIRQERNIRLRTIYSCCCRNVTNGFVMRFVAIGECTQLYGRNVNIRFREIYSCYCRSAINGFVMRFVRVYKNGRCGEIPPCRKYDVLQFCFIYQSVADWLCVIVSAPSDLRKSVFFIQLFCRLVITADFKKNAFYAVIFAFIYEIFH